MRMSNLLSNKYLNFLGMALMLLIYHCFVANPKNKKNQSRASFEITELVNETKKRNQKLEIFRDTIKACQANITISEKNIDVNAEIQRALSENIQKIGSELSKTLEEVKNLEGSTKQFMINHKERLDSVWRYLLSNRSNSLSKVSLAYSQLANQDKKSPPSNRKTLKNPEILSI